MSIHPNAQVHPTAEIDPTAEIGMACVVERHCRVGPRTVLKPGAVLGPHTTLGADNVVHYHAVVGNDPQYVGFDPETPSGTVVGDRNIIREHASIHRGIKPGAQTRLGNDNYIMASAHIGHDCQVGNKVVVATFAGISGHVEIADRVFISGLVAVHQFVRIGRFAMLGGGAICPKDIPPFVTVKGECRVIGLNTVGLRRAGFSPELRAVLKTAQHRLFHEGRALRRAIELVRAEWQGQEMPPEIEELLAFCSVSSSRGYAVGRRRRAHDHRDESIDA